MIDIDREHDLSHLSDAEYRTAIRRIEQLASCPCTECIERCWTTDDIRECKRYRRWWDEASNTRTRCLLSIPTSGKSVKSMHKKPELTNQLRLFVCTERFGPDSGKIRSLPAGAGAPIRILRKRYILPRLSCCLIGKQARRLSPYFGHLQKSGWLFASRFSDGIFHCFPDDFGLRYSQLLACITERGD